MPQSLRNSRGTFLSNRDEEIERLNQWLDTDRDALRAESPLARADLISRHGALSVQELVSMSDVALGQEGAREVSWTDSSYQATSAFYLEDGRLSMYTVQTWFKPSRQNLISGQPVG